MGNAILSKPVIKPGEPINAFIEITNSVSGSGYSSSFIIFAKEITNSYNKFGVAYLDGSAKRMKVDYFLDDKTKDDIYITPYLQLSNVTSTSINTRMFDAVSMGGNLDIFVDYDSSKDQLYFGISKSENPEDVIHHKFSTLDGMPVNYLKLLSGNSNSYFWLMVGYKNQVIFYKFSINGSTITNSKTIEYTLPGPTAARPDYDFACVSNNSYGFLAYETKKTTSINTTYVYYFSYDSDNVILNENYASLELSKSYIISNIVSYSDSSGFIIYSSGDIYKFTRSSSSISINTTNVGEINIGNYYIPIYSSSILYDGVYNWDNTQKALRCMTWSGNSTPNNLLYGPNIIINHDKYPTYDDLSTRFVMINNNGLDFYDLYTYPGSTSYKIMKYKDKEVDRVIGRYCLLGN